MSDQYRTYEQPTPTCPHCGYVMSCDDMVRMAHTPLEPDLFGLAVREEREAVTCPSCDTEYWVQGGYKPHYTTAFAEGEL